MICLRAFLASLLLLLSLGAAAASITIPLPDMQMPDFKRLERELHLKPHQKAQYDVAVGSLKRTLVASAGIFAELKDQLTEELLKADPDYGRIFRSQRASWDMFRPQLQETLDEWSKLYALLEDDQVVIAKRFLRENLPEFPRT